MTTKLTEGLLDWQERRMSRRGFMAKMGRVAAGIGLVMVGAAAMPLRAHANNCCSNLCGAGCPGTIGCPSGCTVNGNPTLCCDSGAVGSTNTVHQCQQCTSCSGPGGVCYCEYDTGNSCP